MSKKNINRLTENSLRVRNAYKVAYTERFFNLWLNAYETKGLSRDEREFILRRLWADGSVACFSLINANKEFLKTRPEYFSETSLLGFAPYAENGFNMYSRPVAVTLVNMRGTPYVPQGKPMVVGKDVVIISASHTFDPVKKLIDPFIERIVDIEMAIRTNVAWQKKINLVAVTSENELSVGDMIVQLENDEAVLFVNESLPESISVMPSAGNYVIDRLYQYKKDQENEVLTILGINNTPYEKKERLLTDEVNSNNEMVESSSAIMNDCLKESCELVKEVFGVDISFEPKRKEDDMALDPKEKEEEKEDDTI